MSLQRPNLDIAAAKPHEVERALQLVDEVARGLAARHIQQWDSPPPPSLHWLLAREISAGNVYFARLRTRAQGHDRGEADAEPVGLFRFAWQRDPMWPAEPIEKHAAYIYTLAVRPGFSGQNIGATMLDWAATYARDLGRQWLRLDCLAHNARLRTYYQDLGFTFIGLSASRHYALFEKSLERVGTG